MTMLATTSLGDQCKGTRELLDPVAVFCPCSHSQGAQGRFCASQAVFSCGQKLFGSKCQ